MSDGASYVKSIGAGVLVVLASVAVAVCLFGISDQIRLGISGKGANVTAIIVTAFFVLAGSLGVAWGTVRLDPRRGFIENAWLAGASVVALCSLGICVDVFTKSLDPFGTGFCLVMLTLGWCTICVSVWKAAAPIQE